VKIGATAGAHSTAPARLLLEIIRGNAAIWRGGRPAFVFTFVHLTFSLLDILRSIGELHHL
jgi:hypothetical protein